MKTKNILTVDEVISYTGFSQKQIYKLTLNKSNSKLQNKWRKTLSRDILEFSILADYQL